MISKVRIGVLTKPSIMRPTVIPSQNPVTTSPESNGLPLEVQMSVMYRKTV